MCVEGARSTFKTGFLLLLPHSPSPKYCFPVSEAFNDDDEDDDCGEDLDPDADDADVGVDNVDAGWSGICASATGAEPSEEAEEAAQASEFLRSPLMFSRLKELVTCGERCL